jgi:hypothetical protein
MGERTMSTNTIDRAEPYGDAAVYGYSVVQHRLAEEMSVQTFADPTDRTLLAYLYSLKENRWGLVEVTAGRLAEKLDAKADDMNVQLDALQTAGHIYRDKFFILLLNWRRYMGVDNAARDVEGRLYVTKGMAKIILSLWNRLTTEGQKRYLASCGLADKTAIVGIIERPDPRGGDHSRSKAGAKPEQSGSKAAAEPEQSGSKAGAKNKSNELPEPEDEAVEESEKVVVSKPTTTAAPASPNGERFHDGAERLANLYAQKWLGRNAYSPNLCGDSAYPKFLKAAQRVAEHARRNNRDEGHVVGQLFDALADEFGSDVKPGNLCADDTWNRTIPAYLKKLYE